MNSHTPKKVSVSCSLIKKKGGDSKDNFDFVFGEVPEAKLSLKKQYFCPSGISEERARQSSLKQHFQRLETSRSKTICSSWAGISPEESAVLHQQEAHTTRNPSEDSSTGNFSSSPSHQHGIWDKKMPEATN